MRALPVRRLATTTLCAALLLGTAGPALASVGDASRDQARTAPRAPAAPDPLAQVQQLINIEGVLKAVSELLTAVLKAPGNKLSPEDVKKHTEALKKALEAAAKPPAKGATEAVPKTATEAVPKTVTGVAARADKAPLDPKADAVAALQKAVDALLKAATAGDIKAVAAQVPTILTGVVNFLVASITGGGLPAPALPETPALPKTPAL
ncbi:hypothetical protein DEJ49_19500 [Streptomyces venezuelae]|uniref:Secreted protein n=1 Tax=Streptomyces venezuelae TaxID=54571 RepID=A0A5P2CJD7_STRVZ|nr:hypothetical protein [Streptomyces venezuelae]QES42885.1 hypothetical protein DEJ49_19500 [Streptomyces venezuelae]